MNEFFTPSIIAALTSLIISLITLYQFFRNQNSQQNQFNKTLNRNLTSKLYDLRLQNYPKAFEITEGIYKEKGGNYDVEKIRKCLEELFIWKTGIVNLIISVEALDSYYVLRDTLMKNPANNGNFSPAQVEKIFNSTKEFRKQLRRDIGFLFREEKERRKVK